MRWLLWNRRERRLRVGWRILAMLALYLVLTLATMAAVETFLPAAERYVAPIVTVAIGTLAAWLPCRYLDRRPLRSLGLAVDRTWWREFGVGLLLGLLLAGAVLVVYLAAGWASVTGWFAAEDGSFVTSFGLLVAMYVAVAYLEELLFRGYFVTNATEGFSRLSGSTSAPATITDGDQPRRRGWPGAMPVALAVVVSSFVFAHFHGDSLTAMQYGHFWLAGVMLALPYVVTGRLGLSIGLHLTFNVGMTGLFNVEGGLPALVRLEIDGPDLWVGETALVETLMIAVTLVVTLAYLRRRGPLRPDAAFDPGISSGLAARSAASGSATISRQ